MEVTFVDINKDNYFEFIVSEFKKGKLGCIHPHVEEFFVEALEYNFKRRLYGKEISYINCPYVPIFKNNGWMVY